MADLKPLIDLIQAALIPGLLYGIKLLWDIREHLARLNGRVATCEALREQHEIEAKDKHRACETRLHDVEFLLLGRKDG